MERELGRYGAWRHVVRSTEGGKEIVERFFVHQIDDGNAEAPSVLVTVEEVVFAHREVKEVAGRDAGWIVVVILRAGGWY